MLAERIAAIMKDNPGGLASSERWISPMPTASCRTGNPQAKLWPLELAWP
jgi:hypothetical protein